MSVMDYVALGFSLICIASGVALNFYLNRQIARENKSHSWRPALTSRGPARTCVCGATEQLTTEEFYAQFGIMPNVGIVAK